MTKDLFTVYRLAVTVVGPIIVGDKLNKHYELSSGDSTSWTNLFLVSDDLSLQKRTHNIHISTDSSSVLLFAA